MSETQEPIAFEGFDAPKATRTLAVRIDIDTVYYHTAATSADLIAALQQNDALRAEVLRAVLPSAEELAGAILVAIDEAQPGDDGNTALVAAKAVRKAMGVAE